MPDYRIYTLNFDKHIKAGTGGFLHQPGGHHADRSVGNSRLQVLPGETRFGLGSSPSRPELAGRSGSRDFPVVPPMESYNVIFGGQNELRSLSDAADERTSTQ